jgi:type I restriction enzyme S subunit
VTTKPIKLEDVCTIRSGGTPRRNVPEYYDGDIPWAKISDLEQSSGIVTSTEERITDAGLRAIRGRLFPKGTLLFAMYGSVGKMAIAGCNIATNQAILGIEIKDKKAICPDYLRAYLNSIQSRLLGMARGVTQMNLSATIIRELPITLPPLPIQKRIANILDKADAVRRKRNMTIKLCEELLQSVFLDMFGDPFTNTKGFKYGTIRDLVSDVKYGTSGKAGSTGEYEILRMNNITYSGRLDLKNIKYINIATRDREKYLLRKGDLLFNRTNSKELVGKTAVYMEDMPRVLAGYLIRVRANSRANTSYISGYLNSKHGKQVLQGMCKSIIGMANINAQELQDIKILIPPIERQQKYAEFHRTLIAQEARMTHSLIDINTSYESLSKSAFRGEL